MTMQAMVETIEGAGFDVEKVYDKFLKGYRFTIGKNGHFTSALFEYPADTSKAYCDQKQREFIDYIINTWHKNHFNKPEKKTVPIAIELRNALSGHFMAYAVSKKIPCNCKGDFEYLRIWYAGPGPERGIEIIWSEVENICELIKSVVNVLDEWANITKGENVMNVNEEIASYGRSDIASATVLANAYAIANERAKRRRVPAIKTVHFSGPCTVVIWEDGTKTIVRCKDGDVIDYEKGLAMAIAKKALGTNESRSNYYDIFKKWLPKEEEPIVLDYATSAKEYPVTEEVDATCQG